MLLSPDFILNQGDEKIFVEYKSSKWALKNTQSKEQSMRAALIQIFWNIVLNYNLVVWGDYWINDTEFFWWYVRKISETHLASETGGDKDTLVNFFL